MLSAKANQTLLYELVKEASQQWSKLLHRETANKTRKPPKISPGIMHCATQTYNNRNSISLTNIYDTEVV